MVKLSAYEDIKEADAIARPFFVFIDSSSMTHAQ